MKKGRNNYTGQEKVKILRQHLVEKVAISEICEKQQLQPTVFYRWMKQFFENGAVAFDPKPGKKQIRREQRIIEALERKVRRKDEVLGELMEEHVALKKSLGEI